MWDTFQFTWDCLCWQSMTSKISTEILNFCRHPWVNIYQILCQYLTAGDIWELYGHLRDTSDATRPFLVDITSSRAIFRAILVPRDPLRQLRNDCSRVVSSHETVDSDGFFDSGCHLWALKMNQYGLWDGDRALVCRNRPKIDLCGPKSVHDPWWWHFLIRDLGFSRFFYNRYMDMYRYCTLRISSRGLIMYCISFVFIQKTMIYRSK